MKLPPKSKVKIYDIDKIMNSRKKMSTSEKIDHLLELKKTLQVRLNILKSGRKIIGFKYVPYKEWKQRRELEKLGVNENADASNVMEDGQEEQIDKSSSLVEDPKIACDPIQETRAMKKIPKSQMKAMK